MDNNTHTPGELIQSKYSPSRLMIMDEGCLKVAAECVDELTAEEIKLRWSAYPKLLSALQDCKEILEKGRRQNGVSLEKHYTGTYAEITNLLNSLK